MLRFKVIHVYKRGPLLGTHCPDWYLDSAIEWAPAPTAEVREMVLLFWPRFERFHHKVDHKLGNEIYEVHNTSSISSESIPQCLIFLSIIRLNNLKSWFMNISLQESVITKWARFIARQETKTKIYTDLFVFLLKSKKVYSEWGSCCYNWIVILVKSLLYS